MNYKILIAEDEQDIAELLKLYLENEGYCVFWAGNGVEALKILEREDISLAVLDIMMPRMDGYELTLSLIHILPALESRAARQNTGMERQ